ncbi:hypothetical protein RhoFasB10_00715 [Rhodococcus sp. B10]|nr:hypothetical protein [Rhodococcus sp. B10]
MALRPYRSHRGPPIPAPMAAPNAFALNAASSPTARLLMPNSFCHNVSEVAIAMIEPASM